MIIIWGHANGLWPAHKYEMAIHSYGLPLARLPFRIVSDLI